MAVAERLVGCRGPSSGQNTIPSSRPRGRPRRLPHPPPRQGMALIESCIDWWAVPSHPRPRTVDEAEAKGTRLLALEGQTARQGFSPFLLFAAAISSRPPPSRGYAHNRLPTSIEGISTDRPCGARGRRAEKHGPPPFPIRAARPTDSPTAARRRSPSGVRIKALRLGGRPVHLSWEPPTKGSGKTAPPRIGVDPDVPVSRETPVQGEVWNRRGPVWTTR